MSNFIDEYNVKKCIISENPEWIGLTVDEAKNKVNEIFKNKVHCIFVDEFREEEDYLINTITFKVKHNIVIDGGWG
jgi:hypothetical protein